jgi:hypothetical protein
MCKPKLQSSLISCYIHQLSQHLLFQHFSLDLMFFLHTKLPYLASFLNHLQQYFFLCADYIKVLDRNVMIKIWKVNNNQLFHSLFLVLSSTWNLFSGWTTAQRPWFNTRPIHAGFVVDKVALEKRFLQGLLYSPVSVIPLIFHAHSFIHSFIHSFVRSYITDATQAE